MKKTIIIKTTDNSCIEIDQKSSKIQDFDLYFEDFIKNGNFFSFFNDDDKILSKNAKNPIISVRTIDKDKKQITSGNYIGKIFYDDLEVEINSRFGKKFLERMLNFANDVFVDDVSIYQDVKNESNISEFILFYIFVQKLEKSFLIGLPKNYQSKKYNDLRFKGNIDMVEFIKHNIPLKAKVATKTREQIEDVHIINVLYKALQVIEKKNSSFLKNVRHIKTYLVQNKSEYCFIKESLNKAFSSKALRNQNYQNYKELLKYAKMIIESENFTSKNKNDQKSYSFIINIAELFEIYISKLLRNNFEEYMLDSPKLEIYKNSFYKRYIIPDIVLYKIVLYKDDNYIVFDTKYKKMTMEGKSQNGMGDLDRNDLFQIHTYMGYYQKIGKVLLGGLLYPMQNFNEEKCHSENSILSDEYQFIVDGIFLEDSQNSDKEITLEYIIQKEEQFIKRIKKLLK
ncbi:5-methylcytosine restriction system specificity protein McrC [Campylobacter coli]